MVNKEFMATVFLDYKGIFLIVYNKLRILYKQCRKAIGEKRSNLPKKIIFHQNKAKIHQTVLKTPKT